MNVRQCIRPDITASAIAHLSVVALVFLFTEVHPFGAVTAEPIAVDIVRLDEIGSKIEPDLQPQLPSNDVAAGGKQASAADQPVPDTPQAENVPPKPQQQPTRQKQKGAALQQKQQSKQVQQAQQAQQPPQPQPQPQAAEQSPTPPPPRPVPTPSLGYIPAEPDLTIKYNVMLGLPEDIPVTLPRSGDKTNEKSGDGGDATATTKADVSSSVIEEFRRHLKTCSKLPADVAPSDSVRVKLRVVMTLEGRLATDPILMEASASAKGPLLMQSAKAALAACQPYTMLPPNRYGEWKVIDLLFTPDDFSS